MPDSTSRPRPVRRPVLSPGRTLAVAAACLLVTGALVAISILSGLGGSPAPAARVEASSPPAPTQAAAERPAPGSGACAYRPTRSNSGARGALQQRGATTLADGSTLQDVRVPSLEISGSDVTVRNVQVDGRVLVTGDRVRIRRVTAQGVGISSASDVSVKRSRIESSPDDAFHVTSDAGELVTNVTLDHNFVHRPVTPSENHYDGVQVRGADGMRISCSTFRAGRYHDNFNAAVFLENANGGTSDVEVDHNWFFGFAFSVMVDSPSSTFTDNKIGGDIQWGPCLLLESAGDSFTSDGNTWAEDGRKVNFCGQG